MTHVKRRGVTLIASLTLATAMVGAPVAAQSGTIVVGEWQTPLTLQPYYSNIFVTSKALSPSLLGLLAIDNEGQWIANLAAEIPSIENGGVVVDEDGGGFTLTLSMKPGLTWSDGQPLTMHDFAFTYDWLVENAIAGAGCLGCGTYVPLLPGTPTVQEDGETPVPLEEQYALANRYIQDITVSDDGLSATVTWQRKFAGWLGWGAFPILPKHYFENVPAEDGPTSMPVGPGIENIPWSGPFVITSASAEGIDYAPNPEYRAGNAPQLEGLRYRFFGSKDGMIQSFLAGEVDLIDNMTQADYAAIASVDPAIGRAEVHPAWQYEHLDINTSRSNVGLDDPNVRKAILQGIDKEDLWNTLFPGTPYAEACTNAPPGTWWRAEVTCAPFDPEAAGALLDTAGWTLNAAGQREKDGTVMRLKMCTTSGNPTRLTTLGKINGYLLALGIPTDIQTADAGSQYFAGWADVTAETECSIYRGNFDIALFTYILGGDPGGLYYDLYHTSGIPSDANPNGSNDTRMSHPDMDAALEAFQGEVDPAILFESAATIQQLYADLVPEIALYYRAEPTGVGAHLDGFLQNPSTSGPLWNVQDWTFVP
ncbi:MAG: peptide ABC transporter substrate-binding protein [Chloroflexi bacterium]|nr:peptide ABC transporter substrate-binding protein [Chloroflexota bacterium]